MTRCAAVLINSVTLHSATSFEQSDIRVTDDDQYM